MVAGSGVAPSGSVGSVKHGLIGVTAYTIDYTHRVSWVIHNGAIPPGMAVLHRCDIGECVNPEHLFLGTQTDNMKDMQEKGRARGRCSYAAKKTTPYIKAPGGGSSGIQKWIRKVDSGRPDVQGSLV